MLMIVYKSAVKLVICLSHDSLLSLKKKKRKNKEEKKSKNTLGEAKLNA